MIAKKNDWQRYVEQEPEMYENEELGAFFKACDEEELVLFETFLMTGMREQEMMHLTWRDIDLNHGVVRVRHKPEFGWTPKAYKEREIPIPDRLVQSLKRGKAKADAKCPLVFPNSDCSPNGHFLRMCKGVAKRAELPEDDFWLHKFRANIRYPRPAFRCRFADRADVDGAHRSREHDALLEAQPGEGHTGGGQCDV